MTKVFLVQHSHILESGEEDVKIIGIYSSAENARSAITRLQERPGFGDSPGEFFIDEYSLNHDHWSEGFASVVRHD
jgi:hypothetical protein